MDNSSFELHRHFHTEKFAVAAISLSLLLIVLPIASHSQEQGATAPALSGLVSSNLNPLQIALLHWYGANQATSFTVVSAPFGVAFDGASVWIANFNGNNVTKLRANDGVSLGTFTLGASPSTLAYDICGSPMSTPTRLQNCLPAMVRRSAPLLSVEAMPPHAPSMGRTFGLLIMVPLMSASSAPAMANC